MKFDVPVRNDHTEERWLVVVEAGTPVEAQVEALHRMFRQFAWNVATAAVAVEREYA